MTRYLVTGSAGFIGSHLIEALARTGHEVRVLDDLSAGRIQNLLETFRAQMVVGDVRDPDRVRPAARCADRIFHLAAGPGSAILRHILRLRPDIIKLSGHDSVGGRYV
jgi:UDP-glucose 4-epimerase